MRLIEENKCYSSKLQSLEQQLKEKSSEIEQISREKVSSSRESCSKDILIKELDSKNKELKRACDKNVMIIEDL